MVMSEKTKSFYNQLSEDYHLIFRDWHSTISRQGEVLNKLIQNGVIRSLKV